MSSDSSYYVPASSRMPIFMAFGLLLFVLGASFTMNNWGEEDSNAHWLLITSFAVIWGTMFFWFGSVIKENDSGMYSGQLNQSFVWGMAWFIFSEVMFFFAFFLQNNQAKSDSFFTYHRFRSGKPTFRYTLPRIL